MNTLYHFSNENYTDFLTTDNFGIHNYTNNDKKLSGIKRIFFYTDSTASEARFKRSQYCYTVKIDNKYIYDLQADNNCYIKQAKIIHTDAIDFDRLFDIIKANGYKGVSYTLGYNVVCLFENIAIYKKETL